MRESGREKNTETSEKQHKHKQHEISGNAVGLFQQSSEKTKREFSIWEARETRKLFHLINPESWLNCSWADTMMASLLEINRENWSHVIRCSIYFFLSLSRSLSLFRLSHSSSFTRIFVYHEWKRTVATVTSNQITDLQSSLWQAMTVVKRCAYVTRWWNEFWKKIAD